MATDDDIRRQSREQLAAATAYQVSEGDEWLISIISRIAKAPGPYVGSKTTSDLSTYLTGYRMARIDAGLASDIGVLSAFSCWILGTGSTPPTLWLAMQEYPDGDKVETFFRLFDAYIRERGRPSGLGLKAKA